MLFRYSAAVAFLFFVYWMWCVVRCWELRRGAMALACSVCASSAWIMLTYQLWSLEIRLPELSPYTGNMSRASATQFWAFVTFVVYFLVRGISAFRSRRDQAITALLFFVSFMLLYKVGLNLARDAWPNSLNLTTISFSQKVNYMLMGGMVALASMYAAGTRGVDIFSDGAACMLFSVVFAAASIAEAVSSQRTPVTMDRDLILYYSTIALSWFWCIGVALLVVRMRWRGALARTRRWLCFTASGMGMFFLSLGFALAQTALPAGIVGMRESASLWTLLCGVAGMLFVQGLGVYLLWGAKKDERCCQAKGGRCPTLPIASTTTTGAT